MFEYHKKESPVLSLLGMGGGGTGTALGGASADPIYVDDVFSTYLYDGTGGAQTITNGIDLSGEGGMVWTKSRTGVDHHSITDTERGYTKRLRTNTDSGENTYTNSVTSFNSDGFSLGTSGQVNQSGSDFASWTFRKQPGFFDVVTYTGNGVAGREIAHNLGSTPGMVIVKRTNTTEDWTVFHRNLWTSSVIDLNKNAAKHSSGDVFDTTAPTSTVFTVGSSARVNADGSTYVAYIFAHDDQSFGTNGDEAIIKCGSYTGSASDQQVNLGFEPQLLLLKNADDTAGWFVKDNMRGLINWLKPNSSAAEITSFSNTPEINATGFTVYGNSGSNFSNSSANTYIYVAIRRSHKPPTAGTDVLDIIARSGSGSTTKVTSSIESIDFAIVKSRNTTNAPVALTRLLGNYGLETHAVTAATTNVLGTSINPWDIQDGIRFTGDGDTNASGGFNYINYFFKRAAGFFDVVTYTGNASARLINHNLNAVPELIIVKRRDGAAWWYTYSAPTGNTKALAVNRTDAVSTDTSYWNDQSPTNAGFYVGDNSDTNGNTYDFVAYLFASLDGVSKVGTYSGTGNDINVDCGFSSGARFILIKRTDTTGDWYVIDSTRGIGAGNDSYILLNDNAAEVSNNSVIDVYNAGFQVTEDAPAGMNASGGTYIFLAIA